MRGISVIVPVWNSGKYLRRCVDSVLAQTFTRWELILVDDGSDDGSAEICREYADTESRIRMVSQPHAGLSVARNTGLDAVRYDYVTFIDSDDAVNCGMFGMMYDVALENPQKIVSSDQQRVDENFDSSGIPTADGVLDPISYSPRDAVCETLYQGLLSNSVCGKLYPAELFRGIRFREGILYEDLDIDYRLTLASRGVCHMEIPLYYYRRNPDSLLHSFTPGRLDVLDVTDRISLEMKKYGGILVKAADSRRLSAHFNILCEMAAAGIEDEETRRRCIRTLRVLRRSVLRDRYVRMKNKAGIILSYIGGFRLVELAGRILYRHS